MKRALLAALLSLLALSAGAADAPRGGFSTKSFGEGGGYKHPDAATGQYLEDAPRQEVPPSSSIDSEPRPPETNTPASAPIARVSPVAPVPGRPAAPRRDVAPPAKAAPRVSLWRGLVSPLDMPSSQAGVADPELRATLVQRLDHAGDVPALERGGESLGLPGIHVRQGIVQEA